VSVLSHASRNRCWFSFSCVYCWHT